MSYIAATAAFMQMGVTYLGMQAQRVRSAAEGNEYDSQALQTLLTAKWNIGKIQESGFHQEIDLFDQASNRRGLLKRHGTQALGKMKTSLGASGVRMDSGTAADLVKKSRLDNLLKLNIKSYYCFLVERKKEKKEIKFKSVSERFYIFTINLIIQRQDRFSITML